MIKYIANIVTGCRILGGVLLLLFPVFSVGFYITYIICGFSDMIDGTIARKTNSDSESGAKIDTLADLVFIMASLIKILPTVNISDWLWIWGILIAIIKVANIVLGYVYKKQFIALHSMMNKITGMLLFLLPLTFSYVEMTYSFIAVCFIATFSSIQEGFYIVTNCETKADSDFVR